MNGLNLQKIIFWLKNTVKWLHGVFYCLLLPVFIYPPGKFYQGNFYSINRTGIIQFLDIWSDRIQGKVLDVGVGTWTYPRHLLENHCEYLATDCFEHPNVNVLTDIHTLSETLLPESFDFVICLDVLEHVQSPWVAARQLFKMLKPGGILLLTTPFNYRLHANSLAHDYWRFTADGLTQLLVTDAGFVKVEILPNGHPDFPFGYLVAAYK